MLPTHETQTAVRIIGAATLTTPDENYSPLTRLQPDDQASDIRRPGGEQQ